MKARSTRWCEDSMMPAPQGPVQTTAVTADMVVDPLNTPESKGTTDYAMTFISMEHPAVMLPV